MKVLGTRFVLAGLALCFILAVAGYFVWSAQSRAADASFFPDALKEARIDTAVTVASKRYVVAGGVARLENGSVAPPAEAQSALRLAYAQALAMRNPLYGLPGTDPDRLAQETESLASAQQALAGAQTNEGDARAIRDALYPIDFLRSLTTLERARQTFIASGADADEGAYERALTETIAAYEKNLSGFEATFRTYAGTTELLDGFVSTISVKGVFQQFTDAHEGAERVKKLAQGRSSCLGGQSRSCNKADLGIQLPVEPPTSAKPDAPALARANEILSAYAEAGDPHDAGWETVALSTSDCLLSFPAPYLFSIARPDNEKMPLTTFLYLRDIYATRNLTRKEVFSRAHGIDMPSDYMNPIAYYRCPDMGNDVSRATATILTARFASSHPDIARDERVQLLETPVREDAAVRYIRAALSTSEERTGSERDALIALSLMFVNNSAGLDVLMHEISGIAQKNVGQASVAQTPPPTAKFSFLSGSAFASVFQMYNPSAGGQSLDLYEAIPPAELKRKLRGFFSDSQLSRSQIIQSIRVHMLYETGAYNNLLKAKSTK